MLTTGNLLPAIAIAAAALPLSSVANPHQPPSAGQASSHHHVMHGESAGANATVTTDGIRAAFEAVDIAAHKAMTEEMGIHWTPDPDANYHVSVVLTNAQDGKIRRGLAVALAVVDPQGHVTQKQAEVMSAESMYHYGVDFRRTIAGIYRVTATFDINGRAHSLQANLNVREK